MINEILENSKAKNKLVGIKLYGEAGYWCGIVEDYNDDFIQLKHVTKNGELDGIAIERIVDVERIDIEDDYLTAMKIVIENRQKIRDIEIKSRIFTDLDDENWQYVSLKPYESDIFEVPGDFLQKHLINILFIECLEIPDFDPRGYGRNGTF